MWKARRPRDLMIPPMMERESINEVPQKGPSDLEIAKQVFDKKNEENESQKPKIARGDRKVEGASRNTRGSTA